MYSMPSTPRKRASVVWRRTTTDVLAPGLDASIGQTRTQCRICNHLPSQLREPLLPLPIYVTKDSHGSYRLAWEWLYGTRRPVHCLTRSGFTTIGEGEANCKWSRVEDRWRGENIKSVRHWRTKTLGFGWILRYNTEKSARDLRRLLTLMDIAVLADHRIDLKEIEKRCSR